MDEEPMEFYEQRHDVSRLPLENDGSWCCAEANGRGQGQEQGTH